MPINNDQRDQGLFLNEAGRISTWDGLADKPFFTPPLDVMAYGAKGDGTTNDTAALQAALTAASATGSTVFLPPGTYLLTPATSLASAIAIPAGVSLIGSGYGSVLKVNPATVTANGQYYLMGYGSNCQLSRFRIDGNKSNIPTGALTSVQFLCVMPATSGVTNALIDTAWVHDVRGIGQESFGFALNSAASKIIYRGCKGWNCEGTPFHVNGPTTLSTTLWNTDTNLVTDCTAEDIQAWGNDWMGISFYGTKRCKGRNLTCYNNTRNGINFEWSEDLTITAPVAHGNTNAGIGSFGCVLDAVISGGAVYGNNTGNLATIGEMSFKDGGWYNGTPAYGVAVSIAVRGTVVTPTGTNPHLVYHRSASVNITYQDKSGASVTSATMPRALQIDVVDADQWVIRSNLSTTTRMTPGLSFPGLRTRTGAHTRKAVNQTPSANMTTAASIASGVVASGAAKYTATAQFANVTSPYALRPNSTYVVRFRIQPSDATEWNLAHQDSGSTKPNIVQVIPGTQDIGQWLEGEAIWKTTGNPTLVITLLAAVPTVSSIVDLDYCTVTQVLGRATDGDNVANQLTGVVTWDPPSVAAAAQTTTTVTVTGALLGDSVAVGFSNSLQGMQLTGYVSAADTVTVVLQNGTAGALDLASGSLRADVWQH